MPLPLVPILLGAFAAAGGGALVVAAVRKPSPGWPPLPSQTRPELLRYSAALSAASKLAGKPLEPFHFVAFPPPAVPVPRFDTPPKNTAAAEARFALLKQARPDASPFADGYSRHAWYFSFPPLGQDWKASDNFTGQQTRRDEFGRMVAGVSNDPLGVALQAAGLALPFVPGVGPAAAAALGFAIAYGKGESLEDAALAGARAAIPGGAAGQMAFDLGVAVAKGQKVDAAASQALLGTLGEKYPEALAAYQAGKALGA